VAFTIDGHAALGYVARDGIPGAVDGVDGRFYIALIGGCEIVDATRIPTVSGLGCG